jgi:hypothetical protein
MLKLSARKKGTHTSNMLQVARIKMKVQTFKLQTNLAKKRAPDKEHIFLQ